MRTGSADNYVAHDSQGSVIADTSPSGATESLFTYSPFGDPRTTTNVDPNAPAIPLRFEAQYLDPTGLYQLRARSMNPATVTFVPPDALAPPDTSPAISPYLYAADQPGVFEDPSGQSYWNVLTQGVETFGVTAIGHGLDHLDDAVTAVTDAASLTSCSVWYS